MVDWQHMLELRGEAGSLNSFLSIRALGVAEQNPEALRGSVALRLWRTQCVESTCLKYCFAAAAEWMEKQGAARWLVRYKMSLLY